MTRENAKRWIVAAAGIAVLVLSTGCASKGFVRTSDQQTRDEVAAAVAEVGSQVERLQTDVDGRFADQQGEIDEVSGTAREALERALAAGKLAQGKLLYETVLTDERVHFGFDESGLSEEARAALDEFAAPIKNENANVYIEIQGHTDAIGPESYNLTLGERRAEVVRRYLNQEHHIPLHRMSVISYGESAPIAPNDARETRAQNRRVTLVVLI